MIIAAFQGPVVFEDPEANLRTTIGALEQAQAKSAEILAMPEAFLHGYFSRAEDARRNSVDLSGEFFAGILERLKPFRTTLLLGLNERRGGELYDTVAVIEQGRLIGKYSKNFPIFPYFSRGHEFPVFEKRGMRYGVAICADTSYTEVVRILAMKGARLIFTPHFNYMPYDGIDDHTRRVRNHHVAIAIDNDVFVARSNVVVPEAQGKAYHGYAGVGVGDSFILDRRGRPMAEAGVSRPALLVQEIPDAELKRCECSWRRVSPTIVQALHEQYQQLFARHENA